MPASAVMAAMRRRANRHHGNSFSTIWPDSSLQKDSSFNACDYTEKELRVVTNAAVRIQAYFRKYYYEEFGRLHCRNLVARLQLENELIKGLWRILIQVSIFSFLVASNFILSNSSGKGELWKEISKTLELDSLQGVISQEDFIYHLKIMSSRSKDFFPLGSSTFETGTQGAIELLRARETFITPLVLPVVNINVDLSYFSFTAWVRISNQFAGGYILRKRVGGSSHAHALSCWGWYLTSKGEQELHFGANDFSPFAEPSAADESSHSEHLQHVVKARSGPTKAVKVGTDVLLTLVVEGSDGSSSERQSKRGTGSVSFFVNEMLLSDEALVRPVTDCYNGLEGPLVGSKDMELAQVRFYPFALRRSQIQEILSSGQILQSLVFGKAMLPTEPGSQLAPQDEASNLAAATYTQNQVLDLVQASRDDASKAAGTAGVQAEAATQAAAHGVIAANTSARLDVGSGRQYFSLFEGPGVLTKPRVLDDLDRVSGPRVLAHVPSFANRSVSFSWWHRHNSVAECSALENPYCGYYMLYAVTTGPSGGAQLCWSLWLEGNAIYFENKNGAFGYPKGLVEDRYNFLTVSKTWRHVAFVLDASDDSLAFYLDGRKAWKGPFVGSVASTDCPERRVGFGRGFPSWKYGLEVGVYDLRMYVGSALSAAEVLKLASQRGVLAPNETCVAEAGTPKFDTEWKDAMGRSCEWYHFHRAFAPTICSLKEPATFCPMACISEQPCFQPSLMNAFVIWDRIRTILPGSNSSAICTNDRGSGLGAAAADGFERMRAMCEKWIAEGMSGGRKDSWSVSYQQRTGLRMDLYNMTSVCDQVVEAVDPHCSFDPEPVTKFTAAVKASGGDFTIGLWMRPVGAKSLEKGKFNPSLVFHASMFPPTHQFLLGGFGDNPQGAVHVHSACDRAIHDVEKIGLSHASSKEWTFVAWTYRNSTRPLQMTTVTNLNHNVKEFQSGDPLCLFNESAIFNAIEVNYPMLVSPILMVPRVMSLGELQRHYYSSVKSMLLRRGPLKTNRGQPTVPVTRSDFSKKSSLVAPPMIFQTRNSKMNCSYEYSSEWILMQETLASKMCAAPQSCSSTKSPVSCSGISSTEKTFFGLNRSTLMGKDGFGDMLHSITDHAFLYRNSSLRSTDAFIDKHTSTLQVLFSFFAPSEGTTVVVVVHADMHNPSSIRVSHSVRFYDILEGDERVLWFTLQSFTCILGIILIAIMFWSLREAIKFEQEIDWTHRLTFLMDAMIGVLMPCSFIVGLTAKPNASQTMQRIINKWAAIRWDDETLAFNAKMDEYFEGMHQIISFMDMSETTDVLLFIVMNLNMLRVLQATNLHPRLAVLTGTLGYAMDALMHTIAVALMIFVGFALIGVWRFGAEREDFRNLSAAMLTEFEIMFTSEFPDGWKDEGPEFIVFNLLYLIFMVILVLNFILAIIVDAYMQVMKDVETNLVEQDVYQDCGATIYVHFMGRLFLGWPSQAALEHRLRSMKARLSVSYKDLAGLGLFRDHVAIVSFIKHYKRYSFLAPVYVTKYGAIPQTMEGRIADEMEKRMIEMFNIKRLTTKERVRQMKIGHSPLKHLAVDMDKDSREKPLYSPHKMKNSLLLMTPLPRLKEEWSAGFRIAGDLPADEM